MQYRDWQRRRSSYRLYLMPTGGRVRPTLDPLADRRSHSLETRQGSVPRDSTNVRSSRWRMSSERQLLFSVFNARAVYACVCMLSISKGEATAAAVGVPSKLGRRPRPTAAKSECVCMPHHNSCAARPDSPEPKLQSYNAEATMLQRYNFVAD